MVERPDQEVPRAVELADYGGFSFFASFASCFKFVADVEGFAFGGDREARLGFAVEGGFDCFRRFDFFRVVELDDVFGLEEVEVAFGVDVEAVDSFDCFCGFFRQFVRFGRIDVFAEDYAAFFFSAFFYFFFFY